MTLVTKFLSKLATRAPLLLPHTPVQKGVGLHRLFFSPVRDVSRLCQEKRLPPQASCQGISQGQQCVSMHHQKTVPSTKLLITNALCRNGTGGGSFCTALPSRGSSDSSTLTTRASRRRSWGGGPSRCGSAGTCARPAATRRIRTCSSSQLPWVSPLRTQTSIAIRPQLYIIRRHQCMCSYLVQVLLV